jgi:thiosulfate/3-mercaptopyruvate sulfurtransferase
VLNHPIASFQSKPVRRRGGGLVVLLAVLPGSAVGAGQPGDGDVARPAVATLLAPAPASAPAKAAGFDFEFMSARRAVALVAEGKLQVVDTRPVAKYLAGHVPGALHLRDENVREPRGGLPVQLPDPGALGALFGRVGLDAEARTLVYADGEDPLPATLLAYALVKAGARRVAVLDGGFSAWTGPVTQAFPDMPSRPWTGTPEGTQAATLDDVRRAVATGEPALIDARPPRFFRGEGRAWGRNGRIPGAKSLDWHGLVMADNESLIRPRAEIDKLVEQAGLEPTDETIVYCGTGREATLLYLYLRGVAKWPRVRLFEGSWTEYQRHTELPVETGPDGVVAIHSDGEVSVSGQPTRETLLELADRGVTLIVNCRTPGEVRKAGVSVRAVAEGLGLAYAEVPLGGSDGYGPEDVAALHAVLSANPGERVHLHCAGGPRAATLWAAYLVAHRGLTPAAATERVRKAEMLRETGLERLLSQPLLPAPARK